MVLAQVRFLRRVQTFKFYCMDKRQILARLYQERERCYERGQISRGDEIEDEMWALTKDDEDLPY